jgi:hypothetical protein
MNRSEIGGTLAAGYQFYDWVRSRAGLYAATPVATENGFSRGVVLVGADFLIDWLNVSLEGHLPVVGEPFTAKIVFAVGARF